MNETILKNNNNNNSNYVFLSTYTKLIVYE